MARKHSYHGGLQFDGDTDGAIERFGTIVATTLEDYGHLVERKALFSTTTATRKYQHSDAADTPAGGKSPARDGEAMSVMTMNCFNLDPKVERPELVQNPSRDIDDDIGSGQFASLARAVVFEAKAPALVALQEIQDGDGAEQTALVSAEKTLQVLVEHIVDIGGPSYAWVDMAPECGADGGQPGGNIRSCFLYDPSRVELVPNSLCSHLLKHLLFIALHNQIACSDMELTSLKLLIGIDFCKLCNTREYKMETKGKWCNESN